MKKILVIVAVIFIVSTVITSCATTKNGAGCPTASKTKKFTA